MKDMEELLESNHCRLEPQRAHAYRRSRLRNQPSTAERQPFTVIYFEGRKRYENPFPAFRRLNRRICPSEYHHAYGKPCGESAYNHT